jgi:hypothetical protein
LGGAGVFGQRGPTRPVEFTECGQREISRSVGGDGEQFDVSTVDQSRTDVDQRTDHLGHVARAAVAGVEECFLARTWQLRRLFGHGRRFA